MDTTRIEITGNEIHHLTETLSNSSKGLDSGTVGLIAAVIGASAAILSQLIIFSLDKRKEKNKLKMELVADERRLSLILTAYYKEFIACSVSKAYWYQCSLLKYFTENERTEHYNRHLEFDQKAHEADLKFSLHIAEYFKTITHILRLSNDTGAVRSELEKILSFERRDPDSFRSLTNIDALEENAFMEKRALTVEYQFYNNCFDKIHEIIMKL